MKYYIRNNTLFIRGSFSAASTGPCGGLHPVSTLLMHSAGTSETTHRDPCRELTHQVCREGLPMDFFGVITGNDIRHLCIVQYDYITVFILASPQSDNQADQTSILVYSGEGLADHALLQMIVTVTGAKERALVNAGVPFTVETNDHVIVASEGLPGNNDAGMHIEAGKRVSGSILFGLPHALGQEDDKNRNGPAFYVYSRLGGGHFVRWCPEQCPYYPCHFSGQRCDYCYCPFYPCKDETLGQWVTGSNGGRVWNCSRCTLLHTPDNADYLLQYPEAPLEELKKHEQNRVKKQGL